MAANSGPTWQVEIRVIRRWSLIPLAAVVQCVLTVAVTMTLVWLCYLVAPRYSSSPAEDALKVQKMVRVLIVTAGTALVCVPFLLALFGALTDKKRVGSLLPVGWHDYLITEEGVYALRQWILGWCYYLLYPWPALRLYVLDERGRIVGLRAGRSLLKLYAPGAPVAFEAVKDTVLGYLPGGEQTAPRRVAGFRPVVFAAVFFMLAAATLAGRTLFVGASTGAAGDGRCDICGAGLNDERLVVSVERGEGGWNTAAPLHEYCALHGAAFGFLFPEVTIAMMDRPPSEGGITRAPGLTLWLIVLAAPVLAAISPWGYERRLEATFAP